MFHKKGDGFVVRFSIVGCGSIARKHAESITSLPEAELYSVCDIDPMKTMEFQKYDCKQFPDYEEMLRDENIDVVNICTPSGLHAPLAILAARAGKHVIVEKPMALTLSDADAIINACKENGVKLAVVHPNRFRPALVELKKAMDDNRFGRISHINATVRWNRNQAYYDQADWRGTKGMDGGVLMNQAIHNLDLLLWLGGEVQAVQSFTATRLRDIETEDVAAAIVRFHSGALGIIEAATTIYPRNYEESISIFGETGSVVISGPTANWIKHWCFESLSKEETDEVIRKIDNHPFGQNGHSQIIEDMIYAISENRDPIISGEDGRRAIELVLAIQEAGRAGERTYFQTR
jgi:UDP-N-acetyl-2-amino-2-deoxyglucuronate dehydrogenase